MSEGDGELPQGWTTVSLGHLGMTGSKSIDPAKSPEKQFELWSVPSYPTGKPEIQTGSAIGSSKQSVEPGDVLLCKINPRINRVWVVDDKQELDQIASSEWIVFRNHGIDSFFLMHRLREEGFRERLCADVSGVGGSLTRARPQTVKQIEITIPPLSEQRRIVAKIEALQERSARAREALSEVGPLLEQFRQSVLQAAFSGRLTADWRAARAQQAAKGRESFSRDTEKAESKSDGEKDSRPSQSDATSTEAPYETAQELLARIRTQRRQRWEKWEAFKYEVRGKKVPKNLASRYEQPESSEFLDTSHLPEIPQTWRWASIDEIGIVGSGKRLPKGSKLTTVDTGYPYIRAGNLKGGAVRGEILYLTKEDYATIPQYNVNAGDCYLTIVGASIGDAGTIPIEYDGVNLTENAAKIMPVIDGNYLGYILRSPPLQDQIQGRILSAAQGKLALTRIKQLIVPVPPIAEQAKIAELVTELLERISEAANEADSYDSFLTQLDQSILAKAFRGELVPQDPTDEPASALLTRIRNTREKAEGAKHIAKKKNAKVRNNKSERLG